MFYIAILNGTFTIAVDTALVDDSGEKLCALVSEFGLSCERRMLRANVGNNKVLRCSRCANICRMHVRLIGESLEEINFKYLEPQVAVDGGCGTQNA